MKGYHRLKSSFPFTIPKLSFPLLIFLVCVLLLIIFVWPDPASGYAGLQGVLTSPTIPFGPGTPTAIPADYLETSDQTVGILLGSIVLVLIIIGGTVGVLRRKNVSSGH